MKTKLVAVFIFALSSQLFLSDFVFAQQNQSPILSNLNQYKSDSITPIQENGITQESSVIFKATLTDPDSDRVKLQMELRQFNEPFTGTDDGGISTSDFVNSGSEAVIARTNLIDGQYHWRARVIDDKESTSQWQEFGVGGNIDFEVKLVPLYTQVRSPYPSDAETKIWAKEPYGNGGIGGFAEYPFSITTGDNFILVVNGEDDDAANGTRVKLEAVLYDLINGGINNPLVVKTLRWLSGDNQYKTISANLGFIPAGNYKLRLISRADYFDKNNPSDSGNLDVYLDWLEFRGASGITLRKEAEDISHTSLNTQYILNSAPIAFQFSAQDSGTGVFSLSAKSDGQP